MTINACTIHFSTQETADGHANPHPLLSLPAEILGEITGFVTTGRTPKEAALHAVQWGRVAISPHLMTHAPHIARAINHAKNLDEALNIMWEQVISPRLSEDGEDVPRLTTAQEIRLWMADPNNAPLLDRFTSINLSRCALKAVPLEIRNLRRLVELNLSINGISQVDPQTFTGCTALQWLNLSNNEISQVDPQTFTGCRALTRLNLSDNQITKIDSEVFANCGALQWLDLHNNQIGQVDPRAFTGCRALERLYLNHNQIIRVDPQTFAGCRALERLFLNNNQIVQIDPQTFTDCSALRELHLEHNKIIHINSETFAGCRALEQLHLNNNQIVQMDPQTFTSCTALMGLRLHDNQIVQVDPKTFAGCSTLRELKLSGNQIDRPAFTGCTALRILELQDNRIAQIYPEAFADCRALTTLLLDNNKITQIDPQALAGCRALQALRLDHNKITQIDPQTLAGCPALLILGISHNPLLYELIPSIDIRERHSLNKLNTFFRYICRSQWASFYQALSEGRLPLPTVAEFLRSLEDRDLIYEMVHLEAKETAEQEGRVFSDGGDPKLREHHACDNEAVFYRALKRAVLEKFARLSPEQKDAVHGKVYEIAQEDADPALSTAPSWGEIHKEDNVLRLIDAMASISGGIA